MGDGIGRHRNDIGSIFKAFKRFGANIAAGLFKKLTVVGFHRTGLKSIENHLCRLIEALSGRIHIDTKAIVFDPRQTAAHTNKGTTIRHIVEHRHIGSNTQRVFVPGQNNRRSTDLNGTGLAGHKA